MCFRQLPVTLRLLCSYGKNNGVGTNERVFIIENTIHDDIPLFDIVILIISNILYQCFPMFLKFFLTEKSSKKLNINLLRFFDIIGQINFQTIVFSEYFKINE